jgi:CxxC motif-containing protein (DUF1111 family)
MWSKKVVTATMCASVLVLLTANVFGQKDPGPRGGAAGAGNPVAGLSADQLRFFNDGAVRFNRPDTVSSGLGPTFNADSCGACHSQPAEGGSSPATNPQVALASAHGASNKVPSFISANSPVREARFKYQLNPDGSPNRSLPDGGVHDLFTIAGRDDAPGCTADQLPQPNFAQALATDNVIFRIPTPAFGVGLIENIAEATILANMNANARAKLALGITGHVNRSGNDGTITRFGWKAQNKSLLIFAGEAYNVEVGVTNEAFPDERGGAPPSCLFNPTPEDISNALSNAVAGADDTQVLSDITAFANFMRFLDQPAPSCTGSACSASIQNGNRQFHAVGCALCHTPSMTTTASQFAPAALSNVQVNLFSDLLVHNMGFGLADGIAQGNATGSQFRTAPLWGVGQRLYFLHDGRTSDLLQTIQAHSDCNVSGRPGPGGGFRQSGGCSSEANAVIDNFNALTSSQQQDILNFLRSL